MTTHINIVDAMPPKTSKRGMFTHAELAVINACLNIAREMCITGSSDAHMKRQFLQTDRVETPHGSKIWSTWMRSSGHSNLSSTMMQHFTRNFERALSMIAGNRVTIGHLSTELKFWEPQHTGFSTEASDSSVANRSSMTAHAKHLKKNVLFTYSVAGTKHLFDHPEYEAILKMPESVESEFRERFIENREIFVEEKYNHEQFRGCRKPDGSLPDNATVAPNELKDHCGSFHQMCHDYEQKVNEAINNTANKLLETVWKDLREALSNPTGNFHLFFDIGLEFYTDNNHTFLLHSKNCAEFLRDLNRRE